MGGRENKKRMETGQERNRRGAEEEKVDEGVKEGKK